MDKGYKILSVFVEGDWVEVDRVSDLNLGITRQRLKMICSS